MAEAVGAEAVAAAEGAEVELGEEAAVGEQAAAAEQEEELGPPLVEAVMGAEAVTAMAQS